MRPGQCSNRSWKAVTEEPRLAIRFAGSVSVAVVLLQGCGQWPLSGQRGAVEGLSAVGDPPRLCTVTSDRNAATSPDDLYLLADQSP